MQNAEAARYARWSAIAAILIAASVAGVFLSRSIRENRARRSGPKPVSAAVQQDSAEFSFSKVEQDRTIYTVKASRATQFKDQDLSVLEDVAITMFGVDGSRNDTIHTRECKYETGSGRIRCEGAVHIEVKSAPTVGAANHTTERAGAAPAAHSSSGNRKPQDPPSKSEGGAPTSAGGARNAGEWEGGGTSSGGATGAGGGAGAGADAALRVLKIDTSDVTFDRDKGFASTARPVQFQFPNGDGKAVGMKYDSKSGAIDLDHDVEIHVVATNAANAVPVILNGNELHYDRGARVARLEGAARARQGEREITAETLRVEMDADMHARHATALGHPQMRTLGGPESIFVRAGEFQSALSPAGWIETVSGSGDVEGDRKGPAGTSHFAARAADVTMEAKTNQPRTMHSSGAVKATIRGKDGAQQIDTEVLDMTFAPGLRASQTRIDTATMPVPAAIDITQVDGVTHLHTTKGRGEFDTQSRIRKFFGDSGVQILRRSAAGVPQKTTAERMVTLFNDAGLWDTIDLDGNVRFNEADRSGEARHARLVQESNLTTMDGAPAISDATSRTTATSIQLQQDSGAVNANGGVRTTYRGNGQSGSPTFGNGVAIISGDTLTGSTKTGHLVYSGHAHLWQGDSVLDAQTIELWREEKRIDANGSVVAVFPQGPDKDHPGAAPTLWKVRAPTLRYWDDLGRAHLEEGVFADSIGQSIRSKTLDVYLTAVSPAAVGGAAAGAKAGPSTSSGAKTIPASKGASTGASAGTSAGASTGTSGGGGGRQLDHAMALGNVFVTQGDRRATGERADYTAADEKFVMSGGKPTFTDASKDTTTGRSLTFYRASDTILVDSDAGSRTLTKHRVEK